MLFDFFLFLTIGQCISNTVPAKTNIRKALISVHNCQVRQTIIKVLHHTTLLSLQENKMILSYNRKSACLLTMNFIFASFSAFRELEDRRVGRLNISFIMNSFLVMNNYFLFLGKTH